MSNISEKLNILFFITDQQRADHLSCAGNSILKTPNIDSIARGGIRFTNYYCATPICMPNRASLFTGAYASVHGTRSNGINLNPEFPTLSGILRKKDYHTVSIGKCHFNLYAPPYKRTTKSMENIHAWTTGQIPKPFPTPYYGFDEVLLTCGHGDVMTGHYMYWLEEKSFDKIDIIKDVKNHITINDYYHDTFIPEDLYPTTYIADKTVEFIERHAEGKDQNKPFFLHCSFNDPHHPVCPPGKYKNMYNPEDIELPSNFDDGEKLFEHEFLGQHIKDARFKLLLPQKVNKEVARIFTALTYGSIAMIDDGVGRILRALEKSGMADNTMIIFTSDHGDLCGDHGLILKGPAHYKGLINMPLLWKVPGLTKTSVSNSLVSTIDLPKTILNLLGMQKKINLSTFQGQDASPILSDPKYKIRNRLLIEHDEEIAKDKVIRLRSLVNEKYRLTIYDNYDNFGDIFNLKNDPEEINNLWYSNKELRANLTDQLLREIISLRPRLPKRNAYN